jgi:alcohol dehydrogenase (cytochrome c)
MTHAVGSDLAKCLQQIGLKQPPDTPKIGRDSVQAQSSKIRISLLALAACFGGMVQTAVGAGEPLDTPSADDLLRAGQDDNNWVLFAKTYAGNRYTALRQIDKTNVGSLHLAWSTRIADNGQQETSPIIWNGRMYLSTAHDGVMALDAATGKLLWQVPYNPAYVLLYAVNRGVGLADGKVFVATADCRIIALDAGTGKSIWNVQGCLETSNSFYSMAAYIYKDQLIVGTGGGDSGNIGLISAFSVNDGERLWDWRSIPGPGEPGHETWPGDSWKHGAGAMWNGIAIDQGNDTLFVTPGNPGPDLVLKGRKGRNLYTNSLVALDISGKKPRMKWYYQLVQDDSHDTDPAMIPVLFEGLVNKQKRSLVAIGDKGGDFVILDRGNGEVVHRTVVDKQEGLGVPPTKKGELACPNHGGGIQWNGGAYDPATNIFIVPSTNECAVFKITTDRPAYIPGQLYLGGALPKRQDATGVVTAIDVDSGAVRWRQLLPYPGQGGVLVTATGLAFTSDVGGNLYAFDAATGQQYWKEVTGSSIVAPIAAYSINGNEYLTVVVGEAGGQQTPNLPPTNGSRVLTYSLGSAPTIANDATGQVVLANAPNPAAGAGAPIKSSGSAPYTQEQVAQGAEIYARQCANCHGSNLQGVSAPALTGPSFGRSHLDAAQLRSIVVDTMPPTARGTLKPDEYAAVLAYLLSYDCVPPAGNGKQRFPTTDAPSLKRTTLGGTTCAVGPSK